MMWLWTVLCLIANLLTISQVSSECANACSFHGRCGAYDMCFCWRGWIGNDCSQRLCPFAHAHVDSPKGDLDESGKLTGPSHTVTLNSQIYPRGTTEQYPNMVDSKGNILSNTGHDYAECANKGICDRKKGLCQCFPGYAGSACQRTNCPITNQGRLCSGHGMCRTLRDLAKDDYNNSYYLWDVDVTMGCACDEGYQGADCSFKTCKAGIDPLYSGEYNNPRYSNFTFVVYTTASTNTLYGTYKLLFYDWQGHPWLSDTITYGGENHPNLLLT